MKEKSLMTELIGEVFGTFILILLGDGVVANVVLGPRTAPASYNWNTIAFGWCFAVIVAVYVSAGVSGAHLNCAVTLAVALKRGFPWAKVVPYMIAQVVGAFLGALAVFLTYYSGLVAAGLPNVWTSGPGSVFTMTFAGSIAAAGTAGTPYPLWNSVVAEIFGTAVLLWGILASGDSRNTGLMHNLSPFLVGFTVLAVGLSLSGPSGYSLNPARDFGPRLLGLLIGTKGLFDTPFWLVSAIIGPFIGGVVGVFTYDWFVTLGLGPAKS